MFAPLHPSSHRRRGRRCAAALVGSICALAFAEPVTGAVGLGGEGAMGHPQVTTAFAPPPQAPPDTTDRPFAPRFAVDHWSSEEGLPSNTIQDLIQSDDGYLWMITSGAVVRFDGSRFVTYRGGGASAPDVPNGRAFGLVAAGDSVWAVVTESGQSHVVLYYGGKQHLIGTVPGVRHYIHRDAAGTFWLYGVTPGLTGFGGEPIADPHDIVITRSTMEFGVEHMPQMVRDRFGDVWVRGAARDSIGRIDAEGRRFVSPSASPVLVTRPSTNDVLFASIRGDTVDVTDPDGTVLAQFRRRTGFAARFVDRAGRLWATHGGGVEIYELGSLDPVATLPVTQASFITSLLEDREGNVWVRTYTDGLYRIRELPAHVIGMADGILETQVLSVARGQNGSMLAVDRSGALYRIAGGRVTVLHAPETSGTGYFGGGASVRAVAEDRNGTLWMSWGRDPQDDALIGRRPGRPDIVLPMGNTDFRVIAEDPRYDGSLWVGAFPGSGTVYRGVPSGGTVILTDTVVVSEDQPRALSFDPSGAVWVAGDTALYRIEGDVVQAFNGGAFPEDIARSVVANTDSGTVWVGTYGAGLVRFRDGVFQAATQADGLVEDVVSTLLDDGLGNLWMAGNRSVHRVSKAELEDFFAGDRERLNGVAYMGPAGIPNAETSGWQGARDDAGRLWFPTMDGIAVIDPARAVELESTVPLVHVEEIRPSDGPIRHAAPALGADTALRLAKGERRFDVAYTALSLRDPDAVRFRYMLEGFDEQWQEAGNARTATYTNVGAGSYTFRVQAVSGGGVESEEATLALVVAPFFYETAWFLVLASLALVGVAVLLVRYRERSLVADQARLNELVAARTASLAGERKRAETALETVWAQAERLRALDEARSRFFANVSHEFRTPLTLIVGPLRDLQNDRLGKLPEAAKREIDVVLESGQRLDELVEQLLDISRLEVGELKLQPRSGDVVAFIRRVSRTFEPLARARGTVLEVDLPDEVVTLIFDPDRLEKVIANLLGNAIKFTEKGGRISVTGGVVREGGLEEFAFHVEDDGIGIPEEARGRVFDRFFQADDSPSRRHPGAGVGLSLTLDLVELHGGSVTVESEVGIGSTFTVRLPLAADSPLRARVEDGVTPDDRLVAAGAHEPASAGHAIEQPDPEGADEEVGALDSPGPGGEPKRDEDDVTVLVVEDNEGVRKYLRRHLEGHYRVIEAENGIAGLELARSVMPDLIISDVMMPEMDGQAMVEQLRADPDLEYLPVILLTARASHEGMLAGLSGGADDYVTKPFDIEELVLRAHNLIRGRRRLRERFRTEKRALPSLPPPFEASTDKDAHFTARAHAVLAEHIDDEEFGVEDFARALHMSRSSLYRATDQALGCSPAEMIVGFRLDQAAQWLVETDAKVNEIAYGVGFKSVPHFSRKFRQRFDCTATEYRAR